jgi:hypothetical protein
MSHVDEGKLAGGLRCRAAGRPVHPAVQSAGTASTERGGAALEVLRTEITLQQHMISASSEAAGVGEPAMREQWIDTSAELLQRLAKLERAFDRLRVFMLPRIRTLDSYPLASAIRQANADAGDTTGNDALMRRVRDCENPTWLGPQLGPQPAVHTP